MIVTVIGTDTATGIGTDTSTVTVIGTDTSTVTAIGTDTSTVIVIGTDTDIGYKLKLIILLETCLRLEV